MLPSAGSAQQLPAHTAKPNVDLIDLIREMTHKGDTAMPTSAPRRKHKVVLSAVPAAGYTLQTGLAGVLVANAAFAAAPNANTSTALISFTYTVRQQVIVPLQTNIFTKNNKYVIVGDWRYLKYPSFTYGIGGYTDINSGYLIDYSALRIHETVLRKIKKDMYLGLGYNIDYFWDIEELDPPLHTATDFQRYGLNGTEFAAGVTFNYLYDSRENPINPDRGNYVNVIYRPNLVVFGNASTWRSLVFDLRKYIHVRKTSPNVLALWSYEWLTINGKPPYLMMPNTGSDPYSNTGRGYIQGRFRGTNMIYMESEYRFGISHNGLLGGVVFANAESFTELNSGKFENLAPGWGAGLRLKLNKHSATNIAVDYGFGLNGSQGLFVNLGEVF